MTIRRGEPWGEAGPLTEGRPIAVDDRSLSRIIQDDLFEELSADPDKISQVVLKPVEAGLLGGDLHRSVGSPRNSPDELYSGSGLRLPIDVGLVVFDDHRVTQRHVFTAHLVARTGRGGLWSTRTVVAMNGSFLGEANLGPRAHPNDGRLDIVDGRLGFSDRRKAQRRMPTGTHVPHPALVELRVKSLVLSDDKEFRVEVDGEFVGSAKELKLYCLADAAVIVV